MTSGVFAFFDVDETIIRTKSMFSFFDYWCSDWTRNLPLSLEFSSYFRQARSTGTPREKMNRDYYRFLAGVAPHNLASAGKAWAQGIIAKNHFHHETVAEMRRLVSQGAVPVFVSG